MITKKIFLFVLAIQSIVLNGMMIRSVHQRSINVSRSQNTQERLSGEQRRNYSYNVKLKTCIYDQTKHIPGNVALVQKHFQTQFEQSGSQLFGEICDRLKITPEKFYSDMQSARLTLKNDSHIDLLYDEKQLVIEELAKLGSEFKDVTVVSTEKRQGASITYQEGFAGYNLIAISPLLFLSGRYKDIYKGIVAHEAGHVIHEDSVLDKVLEKYKSQLDDDINKRISHFLENRAEVYASTRGKDWAKYILTSFDYFYPNGVPNQATQDHPAPAEQKLIVEHIYKMLHEKE